MKASLRNGWRTTPLEKSGGGTLWREDRYRIDCILYNWSDERRQVVSPGLHSARLAVDRERFAATAGPRCGNGVVVAPGVFAVRRSGGKNRFPSSAPIRNIYRKNSSMVSRAFLVCAAYRTVQEVLEEVNRLNVLVSQWGRRPMSLSTVSKSLKTLEDDLIIERKGAIRLLQADNLLDKLSENYSPAVTEKKARMKVPVDNEPVTQILSRLSRGAGLPFVATGASSVSQYALMQRGEMLSVYSPRIEEAVRVVPGSQTDRFPNLELVETDDERVFFDARERQGFSWASPVQVYLELMAGDKRDRETAAQVKSCIVDSVQAVHP